MRGRFEDRCGLPELGDADALLTTARRQDAADARFRAALKDGSFRREQRARDVGRWATQSDALPRGSSRYLDSTTHARAAIDRSVQRAVEGLVAGSQGNAFPLARAKELPALAAAGLDDAVTPSPDGSNRRGGGPLMYTLDVTRMYGHDTWVKSLLAPPLLIATEPLTRSHGELPRVVASESFVTVPVPSSAVLAAAAAVAWLAGRAGFQGIKKLRRRAGRHARIPSVG